MYLCMYVCVYICKYKLTSDICFANECLFIGLLHNLNISFANLPWHDIACSKSSIECLQSYLVFTKEDPINKDLYSSTPPPPP